jgi:hypothetical protein
MRARGSGEKVTPERLAELRAWSVCSCRPYEEVCGCAKIVEALDSIARLRGALVRIGELVREDRPHTATSVDLAVMDIVRMALEWKP